MTANDTTMKFSGAAERDEWFLGRLEAEPLPLQDMLAVLRQMTAAGETEPAEAFADMLQETLAAHKDAAGGLALLEQRLAAADSAAADAGRWAAAARLVAGPGSEGKVLVEHAGFTPGATAGAACRKLRKLLSLKPGVLCYEKTWGFGVLRQVDLFYARIEVDFDKKPRHQMALGYAADVLELLPDQHLLAHWHRDSAAVSRLVQEDPAELIRWTLRSFGPLNAAQLQEKLSPVLVAADAWKQFWDAARAALKKDPRVAMPARRNEPLCLMTREKSFDEAWFAALAGERRIETLLDRIEEWLAETDGQDGGVPGARAILGERLAFIMKGAGQRHLDLRARALVAAGTASLEPTSFPLDREVEALLEPHALHATLKLLPIKRTATLLDFLCARQPARTADVLLRLVPGLNAAALSLAVDLLLQQGREQAAADLFRSAVLSKKPSVEMLNWIARHPEQRQAWQLGTAGELMGLMVAELEKEYRGDALRAARQLRDRIAEKDWLQEVFESLTLAQQREMLKRIMKATAWPVLDRNAIVGHIVKLCPHLESLLTGSDAPSGGAPAAAQFTSWRTYGERHAQLEKIVNEEIPRLAKEIGVARSYGDLRENFEYKAAKDSQALLLRRKAELEQMLHDVRPTDFQEFPTNAAGPGTVVTLDYGGGRTETYAILGEWDQDPALGIISCNSQLARVLAGHREGEQVTAPGESDGTVCRIARVTGLTPELAAWMHGPTGSAQPATPASLPGGKDPA